MEAPAAQAATVVGTANCRALDPNLVHGVCLRYSSRAGTGYTWMGTLRAANGKVFFCIDYLYDSRISGQPRTISTQSLVNQLGRHVGDAEVAALNYVISTWAGAGSTGSDHRDAAIALIIREVMGDGVRPDGVVVYPRGLKVGGTPSPPIGGLSGQVLAMARAMWSAGSHYRGGYQVRMTSTAVGKLKLGTSRSYQVAVLSAAGYAVPGIRVRFGCTGPIRCPATTTSTTKATAVAVTPQAVGEYRVRATVSGPGSDGHLYVVGSWHTHSGTTAHDAGVQRGWIAGSSLASAEVSASAEIVKGAPSVTTTTSTTSAVPGTAVHDQVVSTGVPVGYHGTATATLYGPFDAAPGADSCTADKAAGSVTFPIAGNGTVQTPAIMVTALGYYVWVEELPGDVRTNPVTTPCGLVPETTLVAKAPAAPTVRTQASKTRVVLGGTIHDTVRVGGLAASAPVRITWVLHGPLSPVRGSCTGLDWSHAGIVDHGSFLADHNGTYQTATTVLRKSGCVTYSESLPATGTIPGASTTSGTVTETALVRSPVAPVAPSGPVVPEIPSGPDVAGSSGHSHGIAVGLGLAALVALGSAVGIRASRRRWS
ncbi:MAG TPA: hypothetical protein VFE15_00200 [Marmoricola sp.]|nr:hypothetical protein [Marmoricola sp.]